MTDIISTRAKGLPIGQKLRDAEKVRHADTHLIASDSLLRKPDWIRTRIPTGADVHRVRRILRERQLTTVCEEAACPNLGECFQVALRLL